MDAKVLILLLIATGAGGWYCYVAFAMLIVAILKNIKKKEVKEEK